VKSCLDSSTHKLFTVNRRWVLVSTAGGELSPCLLEGFQLWQRNEYPVESRVIVLLCWLAKKLPDRWPFWGGCLKSKLPQPICLHGCFDWLKRSVNSELRNRNCCFQFQIALTWKHATSSLCSWVTQRFQMANWVSTIDKLTPISVIQLGISQRSLSQSLLVGFCPLWILCECFLHQVLKWEEMYHVVGNLLLSFQSAVF